MLGGRWLAAFWALVPPGKRDSQCLPSPAQPWAQWGQGRGPGHGGLLSPEKAKDRGLAGGLSPLLEPTQAPCPHFLRPQSPRRSLVTA